MRETLEQVQQHAYVKGQQMKLQHRQQHVFSQPRSLLPPCLLTLPRSPSFPSFANPPSPMRITVLTFADWLSSAAIQSYKLDEWLLLVPMVRKASCFWDERNTKGDPTREYPLHCIMMVSYLPDSSLLTNK